MIRKARFKPFAPRAARREAPTTIVPNGGVHQGLPHNQVPDNSAADAQNFIIDTQDVPVLTGLVSVNGDLVGRLPLFDLTLTMPPEVDANGRVTLRGVMVTLNAGAAEALNGIFGIEALAGGFDIGRAMVKTRIVGVSEEADDEDGDDDKD